MSAKAPIRIPKPGEPVLTWRYGTVFMKPLHKRARRRRAFR